MGNLSFHSLLLAADVIFGVCTAVSIVYTLTASMLVTRFFSRSVASPRTFPGVTILKPLHGMELALLDNLKSFCSQDYPGEIQFVFGVHDADDEALFVVEELRTLFPDALIEVIVDKRLHGPNRKMSNILNILPTARHDILVFADSDVKVESAYLRHVVGELQQPKVGLVTCLYRGVPDPGFWPRLSAKATNYQFMPSVVTGMALKMARPCFGQTIALRRATLDKIGGFAQFVHHLAEDHAIGEAVRLVGMKVTVPPFAVTHACVETSASKLVAHELRWSRTIRSINVLGHAGSLLMHPIALALVSALLMRFSTWSCLAVAAALCSRLILKLRCDMALQQKGTTFWLLPLWDIFAFALFLASFCSSRVSWRGFAFNVDANGLLYPSGGKE